MVVYKIVRVEGNKLRSFSFSSDEDHSIEYKVGIKTFPKIGKLFAYNSFVNAVARSLSKSKFKIFKCEAEMSKEKISKITYAIDNDIRDFWLGLDTDLIDPPKGTIFCEHIMLLKELKY